MLSEQFILGKTKTKISKEYVKFVTELSNLIKNKNTNVILLENPPFRDETSNSHMIGKSSSSYVKTMMKMEQNLKGSVSNDLSNQFIWSAWNYYLKKDNDSYILFSPIKYWKSCELSNKKFIKGFVFNRHHFHVNTSSAITCILWQNLNENIKK